MRPLIFFLSLIVIFAFNQSYAATITVTKVTKVTKVTRATVATCSCKHKHYKKKRHYVYRPEVTTYYAPAYCVSDPCACGGRTCYPGYYYQCRTEYSYRNGRNSARVEVCY